MTNLSSEQSAIVNAPLGPMSVIACAGSGKTLTSVHRLAAIRRMLGEHRGRVALLSFSNVAVDTFRRAYQELIANSSSGAGDHRVDIETLDGFFTRNVLHPHAYRTMGATEAAFLVMGSERFLKNFEFKSNKIPRSITFLQAGMKTTGIYFSYNIYNNCMALDQKKALDLVHRLGKTGAYTHNLGRYWCYRTLKEQPLILRALARRYPHILIDEAQDIGSLHQAILELLITSGVEISLIGDPNQGIYEFAGANGKFLSQYGGSQKVIQFDLTRNYRSVPSLVTLANNLAERKDVADRMEPNTTHGAFFISYKNTEYDKIVSSFQAAVLAAELKVERSAVLCRGRDLTDTLAGKAQEIGQGTTKDFAQAAITRDKNHDYLNTFKDVVACFAKLLDGSPKEFKALIEHPDRFDHEAKSIRRLLWSFARNPDTGLPSSTLLADKEWHPQLLERVKKLLAILENDHFLKPTKNIGNILAKTNLPKTQLAIVAEHTAPPSPRIRIDTVHQAKGESLDAVLYMATMHNVNELLGGLKSEEGRIGYVAVTRARNLFWLGVPSEELSKLHQNLIMLGFQEVGNVATKNNSDLFSSLS